MAGAPGKTRTACQNSRCAHYMQVQNCAADPKMVGHADASQKTSSSMLGTCEPFVMPMHCACAQVFA